MKRRSTEKIHIALLSTAGSEKEAIKIANHLVQNRLAACVNIIPGIRSIYRWEGKVNEDTEVLMILKTEKSKLPLLKKAIQSLHSYQTPELIAFQIEDGMPEYLAWLSESVANSRSKK